MKNGEILIVKCKSVNGQKWTNSGFCMAVHYKDHYYAAEILEDVYTDVDWCVDEYVDETMRTGYEVKLTADMISTLENQL